MNGLYITTVFLLALIPMGQTSSEWSYTVPETGPENWYKIYKTCKGAKQSPIALEYSESSYDASLNSINIYKNRSLQSEEKFSVVNNGHSLEISLPDRYFFLKLAEPNVEFCLMKIHFHWGKKSTEGSEHSIDGKKFPVEMHLVSYNIEYFANLSEALGSVDGLSVLAVLFEEDSQVNIETTLLYKMSHFLDDTCSMQVGREKPLTPFPEEVFLDLKDGFSSYYRYQGSLTTPPCTENVYWTIMTKTFPIHPYELAAFRCLKFGKSDGEKEMVNNFRPIQPLNSDLKVVPRTVYRSWDAATTLSYTLILPTLLSFFVATC